MKSALGDYAGEAIELGNEQGTLTIVVDPSVTRVTASAKPFVLADESTPQTDVDSAFTAVYGSLVVSETVDHVTVSCGQATEIYGQIAPRDTGCDLVVKIPAVPTGVKLTARLAVGDLAASGVVASQGAAIDLEVNAGAITAAIDGSARIVSGSGDVKGSVRPTRGSTTVIASGNGNVTLALPPDFAADALSLRGGKDGKSVVSAFADVTSASTSRGTAGAGAASITAAASDTGTLTLDAL